MTVYSDDLFLKSELTTTDGQKRIICTLRNTQGRYIADLLRNDSKGSCSGRMIDPEKVPDWCVPGTIFRGVVNGVRLVLTVEPVIQSRIAGLTDLLGDKVSFSYVAVSEFPNV